MRVRPYHPRARTRERALDAPAREAVAGSPRQLAEAAREVAARLVAGEGRLDFLRECLERALRGAGRVAVAAR